MAEHNERSPETGGMFQGDAGHAPGDIRGVPGRRRLFGFSDKEAATFVCTLLFLLVLLAFRPALNDGFINYDDPEYITSNPHVQQGLTWENILWAFRAGNETANWHPLTWFSHMLDCQFFGLNPLWHHLTSVLLHAINTVLLFMVLRKMTRTVWRSFLVAALFGLHPLHVESVAWVSERKDVLSTLFWLLALRAYAGFAEESGLQKGKSRFSYLRALVFFALGLMSKPMLVTFPGVLLLLDYWPLDRFKQRGFGALLAEKIPFFLLAAVSCIITFAVQKGAGAVVSAAPLPFPARLANACVSYCRYLGKIFWPSDLSVFYPHPVHWPAPVVLLALLLMICISLFAFVRRRAFPWLLVGWLWFIGTLVPVIGLVQVGAQAMADRYSYVPSIGVFIMVAWGACELARHLPNHAPVSATAAIALFACIVLTRRQTGYWQNSGTLFRHAIAVTGDNYVAELHLGNYLADQGQLTAARGMYDAVIRTHPRYVDSHVALGDLFLKENQLDAAINELQESLKLDDGNAQAHNDLGVAMGKKGRVDEAIGQLEQAVNLRPDYARAHSNLGTLLAEAGRHDEAIAEFDEALRLQPDFPEAKLQLQKLTGSGETAK